MWTRRTRLTRKPFFTEGIEGDKVAMEGGQILYLRANEVCCFPSRKGEVVRE